jgi:hypothetical protein
VIETENEWLTSLDPMAMLDFLRKRVTYRQLRLFACACLRRVWHLLSDERSRMAVETAERYADGLANHKDLIEARDEAREAKQQFKWPIGPATACRAAGAAQDATRDFDRSAAIMCVANASRAMCERDTNNCDEGELKQQAGLLRDIFGNPFRPITFDPSWRTLTAVRLAHSIYDDRAFNRMSDLGDALEEAGCHDEAILDHCREPGEHVRGCWVVDLVLGKR